MNPDYDKIVECRSSGEISEETYSKLLSWFTAPPEPSAWTAKLRLGLLLLGFSLIVSGVLFFGAFNWEHLGHMQKFGLLEMLIAAFFAGTLLRGLSSIEGRVLLGCASVLVGGLLAVIGQEYQTGADAYLLFLSWAGLIFPWVLASRSNPHWLFQFALIDVSFVLFWQQSVSRYSKEGLWVLFLVLNLTLAAGWMLARRRFEWVSDHVTEFLLFTALAPVSLVAFAELVDLHILSGPVLSLLVVLPVLAYRRQNSVATAATVSGSLMCLGTAILIRIFSDLDILGVLFVGLGILAQLALVVKWLRHIHDAPGQPASPPIETEPESESPLSPAERLSQQLSIPVEEAKALFTRSRDLPWYAQLLIGSAAWTASLVVLCFFLLWIWKSEAALIFFGVALYGVSLYLNRAKAENQFTRHALLSAHISGIMVAVTGVGSITDEPFPCATVAFLMLLGSARFYSDSLGQVFFGMGLVGSGFAAMIDLRNGLGLLIWSLLVGVFLVWSGFQHRRFLTGPIALTWPALHRGLTLGFLALNFIPIFFEKFAFELPLAVGLAALTGWVGRKHKHPLPALGGIVLVELLAMSAPTLAAGLLVFALAFANHQRLLQAASMVGIAGGCFFYYYSLNLDLMTKSAVLLGSGAICLALRLYLKLHSQPEEPSYAV